jgi:hypothetical protein
MIRKASVGGGVIIDAVDASASCYSDIIQMDGIDQMSLQFTSAGTPASRVGTFDVQVSNDGANWQSLTLTPPLPAITTLVAYNEMVCIKDLPAKYLQVAYTATSGTGYITCTAHGIRRQ